MKTLKSIVKFLKVVFIIPILTILLLPYKALRFTVCAAVDGIDIRKSVHPSLILKAENLSMHNFSRLEFIGISISLIGLGVIGWVFNVFNANRLSINMDEINIKDSTIYFNLTIENQRLRNIDFDKTYYLQIYFSDTILSVAKPTLSSSCQLKINDKELILYDFKIKGFSQKSFFILFKSKDALIMKTEINNKPIISYKILTKYNRILVIFCLFWVVFFLMRVGITIRIFNQINNYTKWLNSNLYHIDKYFKELSEKDIKKYNEMRIMLSNAEIKDIFINFPDFYSKFNPPYLYNNLNNLKKLRFIISGSYFIDLVAILFFI